MKKHGKAGKAWWTVCQDCGTRVENVDPKSIAVCACGSILIPVVGDPKRAGSKGKP